MRKLVMGCALLWALAGCSGEKSGGSPPSSSATSSAEVASFTPGRWTTTVEVSGMTIDGKDARSNPMMQQALRQKTTTTTCLSKAQAVKPDPSFFGQIDKSCHYDHFTLAGGKIDSKLVCSRGASSQEVVMSGDYTATSYNLRMTMHTTTNTGADTGTGAGNQGHTMDMAMAMASHQTGPCDGSEEKSGPSAGN